MLTEVGPAFQITDQDFCTGVTVACGMMMVKRDLIIIAHHIQPVAHAGQKFSADLYRAEIANIWLPFDAIIPQALLKHADIKYGIVRNQQAA